MISPRLPCPVKKGSWNEADGLYQRGHRRRHFILPQLMSQSLFSSCLHESIVVKLAMHYPPRRTEYRLKDCITSSHTACNSRILGPLTIHAFVALVGLVVRPAGCSDFVAAVDFLVGVLLFLPPRPFLTPSASFISTSPPLTAASTSSCT